MFYRPIFVRETRVIFLEDGSFITETRSYIGWVEVHLF